LRPSCTSVLLVLSSLAFGAEPEAPAPSLGAKPPEGAIVLFDGTDTTKWVKAKMEDGFLREGPMTKDKFGDARIHLEFNIQPLPDGKRPHGNSGVYIQQRYEIQILNNHGQKAASKGGCGAVYQFKAADVNACKAPGEWQTYDITFRGPRWDGGKKTENARISVVHNGVTIHDNVEVPNKTGHGQREGPEPGPLNLQNHGAKVYYRNIWLLPLKDEAPAAEPAK